MFNEEEMQMLISGGGEGFNVADARSHVNYAGGYHPDHPVMQNFWKVGVQQSAVTTIGSVHMVHTPQALLMYSLTC